MKMFLILTSLCMHLSTANAACPLADVGYTAGCISVVENHFEDSDKNIEIFYQWKGQYDPAKETIVFVNGGPGGSLSAYRELINENALKLEQFNVLLYDQRGVGRSSQVNKDNIENIDLDLYTTNDNVEDLALLIKNLIGNQVIILGHSYGAQLAYKLASTYPELVAKLIVLNGSTDALGNLMQITEKDKALASAVEGIDEERLQEFFGLAQNGEARGYDGKPINFEALSVYLSSLVSTYDGQMFEIKEELEKLIAINLDSEVLPVEEETDNPLPPEEVEQSINFFINMYMVCNDFVTPDSIDNTDLPEDYIFAAKFFYFQACGGMTSEAQGFDTKKDLQKITAPVLMMGGTHDPLVPLKAQKRDYQLLSEIKNNVTFVILDKTGHQIFSESPQCVRNAIDEFLSKDEFDGNKQETCSR